MANKKNNVKINGNSTLGEVLDVPGAEEILAKHKVPCITCPFAKMEMQVLKIKDVCKIYGIDLQKLIKDINANV